MKFLIDAQLPPRLAQMFRDKGFRCLHTSQLERKNNTTDAAIVSISAQEQWIVVSKDTDFFYSFILHRKPHKLVVVKLGNLRLSETISLFSMHLDSLVSALQNNDLVEFSVNGVTVMKD